MCQSPAAAGSAGENARVSPARVHACTVSTKSRRSRRGRAVSLSRVVWFAFDPLFGLTRTRQSVRRSPTVRSVVATSRDLLHRPRPTFRSLRPSTRNLFVSETVRIAPSSFAPSSPGFPRKTIHSFRPVPTRLCLNDFPCRSPHGDLRECDSSRLPSSCSSGDSPVLQSSRIPPPFPIELLLF